MKRGWFVACAFALWMLGCSSPSLHALYGPESLTEDNGLKGEWVTQVPTRTRVVVSESRDGRYAADLTLQQGSKVVAALSLELSLTDIGDDRYVDLFLAAPEREKLASHYGCLALPVHQFMLIRRDGDELRVWAFSADWLQRAAQENAFACEVLPIGGQEMPVVTATTGSFQRFLREHAHDPGALQPPLVFRRAGHQLGVALDDQPADLQRRDR